MGGGPEYGLFVHGEDEYSGSNVIEPQSVQVYGQIRDEFGNFMPLGAVTGIEVSSPSLHVHDGVYNGIYFFI